MQDLLCDGNALAEGGDGDEAWAGRREMMSPSHDSIWWWW
jgi:hypothetical protein